MTATPCCARRLIILWISDLLPTSIPRVGSSRMMMSGSVISQRAISTFCWFPPLKFPMIWDAPCVFTAYFSICSWHSLFSLEMLIFPKPLTAWL